MDTTRRNIVLVLLFVVVFAGMFFFEALRATRQVEQVYLPSAALVRDCYRLSLAMQFRTVHVDSGKPDIEMRNV